MTPTALTQLLRHLPTPVRVEYRRRVEALTTYWAAYMRKKHGPEALFIVRRRMVETVKRGEHFRNHLWSRDVQMFFSETQKQD